MGYKEVDKNIFVAVDIGGTKISIALFEKSKIFKKIRLETNPQEQPTKDKPQLIADNIINSLKNYKEKITEIGIATTGVIHKGYWSVLNKKILGEFSEFPLTEYINKVFDVPVFAFSDTEAAALGEFRFGAGKEFKDFYYITVSTGVGGSMVLGKKLYSKSPNLAGAFGHMVVVSDGNLCGCGRKGCIEAYSSGTALKKIINNSEYKNLTVKDVLLNKLDNPWVSELIQKSCKYLAEGIVNVNLLLGINNFIVGGSIGLNNRFFEEIQKQTSLISSQVIKFEKAQLKNDAELFGCFAKSAYFNFDNKYEKKYE